MYETDKCEQHPTSPVYEIPPEERLKINHAQVVKAVRTLLEKQNAWVVGDQFDHKINTETYAFTRLTRTDEAGEERELWVYVAFEGLGRSDIESLQSLFTPVFIIWVGKGRLSRQAAHAGQIPSMSIGELLAQDYEGVLGDALAKSFDEVLTEYPARIEQAATMARARLRKLLVPGPVTNYTPDQFESDVYALWKHMFPLTIQLGAKRRGLTVPDGLVSYWMGKPASARVYLYDAKLNVNGNGYKLDTDEERKAWDYLVKGASSDVVAGYTNDGDINGYVFVCNKYRDDDPKDVEAFIRTRSGWDRTIAFLTVRDLLMIHGYWMRYRENLHGKDNAFKKVITGLLGMAHTILDEATVTKAFFDLITRDVGIPSKQLDVNAFVSELTEDIGI